MKNNIQPNKVIIFDIESGALSPDLVDKYKLDNITIDDPECSWVQSLKDVTGERLSIKKDTVRVTVPRFVGFRVSDYGEFVSDCFSDNPKEHFNNATYQFINMFGEGLEELKNYLKTIITKWLPTCNILVGAHNFNYDIGYSVCGISKLALEIIEEYNNTHVGTIEIEANMVESLYRFKTISLKYKKGKIVHTLKLVDSSKLDPRKLSSIGKEISEVYGMDLHKLDSYDYDKPVSNLSEMSSTVEELEYNKRDLDICYMSLVHTINQRKDVLKECGRDKYSVGAFPITRTQLTKEVNISGAVATGFAERLGRTPKDKEVYKKIIVKTFKDLAKVSLNFSSVYDYTELAMRCAKGGIIWINPVYQNKIVKDVGSVDIASSYPYQIGARSYPVSLDKAYDLTKSMFDILLPELYDKAYNLRYCRNPQIRFTNQYEYGFVAKIKFTELKARTYTDCNGNKNQIAILSYNERKCEQCKNPLVYASKLYSCDSVVYNLTDVGLVELMAFYTFKSIELIDGVYYRMGNISDFTYLATGYAITEKQKIKRELKEIERELGDTSTEYKAKNVAYKTAKVYLNAMYGATYMAQTHNQLVIDEETGERTLTSSEYSLEDCSIAYPQGLYVAEWGQYQECIALAFCMKHKLPILYAHTDSVKVQHLTSELADELNKLVSKPLWEKDFKLVADKGLGDFDNEWTGCDFITFGNMRCAKYDPKADGVKKAKLEVHYSGLSFSKILEHKNPDGSPKYPNADNMTLEEFIKMFLVNGKLYGDSSLNDEESEYIEDSEKLMTDLSNVNIYIPEVEAFTIQSLVPTELEILSSGDYILAHQDEVKSYKKLTGKVFSTCYDYLERGDLYVD